MVKFFQKHFRLIFLAIIPVILLLGLGGGYFLGHKAKAPPKAAISIPKDKYVAFLSEIYDKIKENYWDKITDEQLTSIFILGTEKLTGQPQPNKPKDKAGFQKMLVKVLKELGPDEKKKEFTAQLADIALANLQPFGRSRLYSQKEEVSLKNTVENKNPEVDQYQVLNLPKTASSAAIKETYQQQTQELKKDKTPEAQQKLAQVEKAYQVLADEDNRKTYDESGVEPTMEYRLLASNIFYIHINKFSPTTIDELLRVTDKFKDRQGLNSLVLDLRNNIGGAIDGLPYFLGPFIGNDQYAYQFYHQGEKEDFKTKIGWLPGLVQYKQVVILINGETQSSAEVMAAILKKYNTGILVGTPSKGWGTVEKVFELTQQIDPQEKYSAFLVHSLTLRDDGQPIEGKGVDPVINTNDPNWDKQLFNYLHNTDLITAVKNLIKNL